MGLKIINTETLLGIGIGFILSAVIIGFTGTGAVTKEEIIQQAKEFGMMTQEEHQALVQEEIQKTLDSSKTNPDSVAKTVPEKDLKTAGVPKSPQDNQEASKDKQATADKSQETVRIHIPRGSDSEKIAQIVIDAGVKTDLAAFKKATNDMKAQRKFQAGDFLVPLEGDVKQVIEILTHRPNV